MNREKAIQSIDLIISALNDLKDALAEDTAVLKEEKTPDIVIPTPPSAQVKEVDLVMESVVPAEEKPAPAELSSIHLQEPFSAAKPLQEEITMIMPDPVVLDPSPVLEETDPVQETITLVMPEPVLSRDTSPAQKPAQPKVDLVAPESYSVSAKETIPEQYQKQEKPIHLILPDQVGSTQTVRPAAPSYSAEKSGVICPKCQSLVPDGSNFCDICGTPIRPASTSEPKRKFCSNCGTEAQPNDRFCMKCGNRLD